MMSTKHIRSIIIFFSLLPSLINAQSTFNDPSDNQIWAGIELKGLNLTNKFSLDVNYQQRYWNNANNLKGHYCNFELGYKINSHIDLLTDYRLVFRDKGQYHRISLGAQYDQKLWKMKLTARILIQNQYQDYTDEINLNKPDENFIYYRGRLKGSYKINKKIDVYGSVEPIFKVGGVFTVDNWRSQIGMTYDLTKNLKTDVYFIYREDYAKATYNRYYYISGINLSYNFQKKAKKFKRTITPEF